MTSSGSTGGGTTVTLVVRPPVGPPSTPTVVVTHPRPHLPFTGFDLATVLVLITLLLAIGAMFLIAGRRPTPHNRRT
jgi:hypothetical protein